MTREILAAKGGNYGREGLSGNFAEMTTSTPFRDLLYAANLQNGTDDFTSPPKEGVLRFFFFAFKNSTASAGFETANLGTKGQHLTPRPPKPLYQNYSRSMIEEQQSKKHNYICNIQ
jgi:hypothetical protein